MTRIRHIAWPPALQGFDEWPLAIKSVTVMLILLGAAAIAMAKNSLAIGLPLAATAVIAAGFGFSSISRVYLRRWRCLKRLVESPDRCAGRIVAIETVPLPEPVVAAHPNLRAVSVWHCGETPPAHEDARDFLVQPRDGTAPVLVEARDLTVIVCAHQRESRYAGLAADELVIVAGDVSHETHPVGDTAGYREPPQRAVYANAIALQVADLDVVIPVHRPLIMTGLTFLLFALLGAGGYVLFTRFMS